MKQSCRCCLTTNSSSFYNIFEQHKSGTTYADNIQFLAEVEIDENDGLSQRICSDCYDELQRIYEFCLKIRETDKKLRTELWGTNIKSEGDEQVGSVQLFENEYFAHEGENGMQVCVMEEVLEDQDPEHDNILMVEEIHDVEEINILEETSDSVKDKEDKMYSFKDNMLTDLALVAATQENVHIENQVVINDYYLPEDENDEDYLIVFDPNEANNYAPQKWKCGDCKVVLRGDVSYEGHMNIHRQIWPHKCHQCKIKYRCRTALKRHKDLKHSTPIQNQVETTKKPILCLLCQKNFYSELTLYLHQAIIHSQGEKCPFECNDPNENNLKQHLECIHEQEMISAAETYVANDVYLSPTYQCFRCSEMFKISDQLLDHIKLCQPMDEEILQDEDIKNENIIEIVKLDDSDISVQCNICQKNLLKKNLNKHMELHKRKEEESRVLADNKSYLCSFCPREFKNSKSLHQHEKIYHGDSSDVVYFCADCDRNYPSQYSLETHRKQAHKERDNICKICGNAFKLRNQLVNHMKLHLEKNIPCPHCDKKYARQFDLNVHLRSHTGEQPYACHLCERKFAIKVRLTYHLQKHYGVKHHCKECGAEFNSKQKLKAHSFKHTGMPYRCQMCDYHGFACRSMFTRHLNRVHHTSITEEALNEMFRKNTGKSVNIKQVNEQNLVLSVSEDDNHDEVEVLGK